MTRDPARSDLYRLIAAGQLARRALLAPIADRGLAPGDDAVVLLVGDGAGIDALAEGTGLGAAALGPRLDRLVERGYLDWPNRVGPIVLTARGRRLFADLVEAWEEAEAALHAGLGKTRRKALRKALLRALVHLEDL
jgi:DNA-binding MarR family transcriptional regulator